MTTPRGMPIDGGHEHREGGAEDEQWVEDERIARLGDRDETERHAAGDGREERDSEPPITIDENRQTKRAGEQHPCPLQVGKAEQRQRPDGEYACRGFSTDQLEHVGLRRKDPCEPAQGAPDELTRVPPNPVERGGLQLRGCAGWILQRPREELPPELDLLRRCPRVKQVEVLRVDVSIADVEIVGGI